MNGFRVGAHRVTLLASLIAAGAPAWAQAQNPAGTLPEVRVDANATPETAASPVLGYRARNAITATKTDTPLSETPQSITIVPRDQLVDQGATNMQDALNYAAGVRSDAYGLDSRTDSVRVRGAYPDVYLDGLRQAYGYYTSTTRTEPYTLERVEVLRGPSGMLYGSGTAAGIVNMVSKRPLLETQREVSIQLGNYGRKQIQADLTGALSQDGDWSYRLVALTRKSDTQVDYVPDDRTVLMPALTWRPSAATSLTLQGLYQKDGSGTTSQFFPWEGTLLANPNGQLPRSRFIGEPGDYYDSERKTFGWQFEQKFGDGWAFRNNFRYAKNENDGYYHYADFGFTGDPGTWTADPINKRILGRVLYSSLTKTEISAMDNNLVGNFRTGDVTHTLLLGADFSYQKEDIWSGSNYGFIDAYAPVYGTVMEAERSPSPQTKQRNQGYYIQDQMKWNNWVLLGGLRYDKTTSAVEGSVDADASATTKRFALLYAHPSGWSPYVSYAESFTPQAPQYGMMLDPLIGEQWEAGVKYEPQGRALAFNAAVYDLRETNRTFSPMPNTVAELDDTRAKGVELEARGRIGSSLDLIANYTYTKVDDVLEGLPENQASVWAKYRFALGDVGGFSVGGGVRYLSSFRDLSYGIGPRIPSVTLLDAMVSWENSKWRLALNLNNLTDENYFSTCLSRGDCWWGAGRTVVASATYRF
ncbi:TonB-dependent siderophore receptor [Variovorax dokdonensis]|uniref:TonB-dependent siderophore receptor n=1 Tax=Variovorax dokdonensis TaxID=344883 RepID=A0ABT7NA36_9BURK|nr:TonB-dependent siderophore receptor [Variovorax dokdonensis]MDM0044798.1 TonB-dependent siderophore receptor [Variovorax dokdonensis]